jgi:hypothetical protein
MKTQNKSIKRNKDNNSKNLGNFRFYSFHSIKGLEIIPDNDFSEMVFGDFTFLSNDEALKILELEKFAKRTEDPKTKELLANDVGVMRYQQGVKSDCLLVIGSYENPKNHNYERANEIISGISNLQLLLSNFKETCCLIDDYFILESRTILTLDTEKLSDSQIFGYPIRSVMIWTPSPPKKLRRKDILNYFSLDWFNSYSKMICRNRGIDKKIEDTILNASRQIYSSSNARTPEMQLIICITAIEILLSLGNEINKYEKLQNRLKLLIGKDAFDFFNNKFSDDEYFEMNLFDFRHSIMHEGKFISKEFGHAAIRLSIFAILQYSEEIISFKSKSEFISYLDLKSNFSNCNSKLSFESYLNAWSKISLTQDIIDPLIFFLYNFNIHNNIKEEKIPDSFCQAVATYSKIRGLDVEKTYNMFSNIDPLSKRIFNNYQDFIQYYNSIEFDVDKNIQGIKNWSWYFNKYKLNSVD